MFLRCGECGMSREVAVGNAEAEPLRARPELGLRPRGPGAHARGRAPVGRDRCLRGRARQRPDRRRLLRVGAAAARRPSAWRAACVPCRSRRPRAASGPRWRRAAERRRRHELAVPVEREPERVELPAELVRVGALRQLAVLQRAPACPSRAVRPHAHRLRDQVAHRARAVVELGRGLHEQAAALEGVAAQYSKARWHQRVEPRRCPCGTSVAGATARSEKTRARPAGWRAAAPPWSRSGRTARTCSSRDRRPAREREVLEPSAEASCIARPRIALRVLSPRALRPSARSGAVKGLRHQENNSTTVLILSRF